MSRLGSAVARVTPILWAVAAVVLSQPTGASAGPGRLDFQRQWSWTTLGYVDPGGVKVVDLDGDGRVEIVVASRGPNSFWQVFSYSGGAYLQRWSSLPAPFDFESFFIGQVDDDPALEVVAGGGSQISIYDGLTLKLERTFPVAGTKVTGLQIADVDRDGALEAVFCDPSDLFIYDFATGALERRARGFGGVDLAVGEVDGDHDLEIAVANINQPGYVVNGRTGVAEWVLPGGFGRIVRLGDLDGDHRDELVAGHGEGEIDVYDVESQSLAYQVFPPYGLAEVRLTDVDGDGTPELVYGDSQWGDIHLLDGSSGSQVGLVDNPGYSVRGLAVGDTDGDGLPEVAWVAAELLAYSDRLYVASATGKLEWQSGVLRVPFYGIGFGDVDADGRPELVAGFSDEDWGYPGGPRAVFDAATGKLKSMSTESADGGLGGIWRLVVTQLDDDPQAEVCVSTKGLHGVLQCSDGLTGEEQWRTDLHIGLTARSLAVADIDLDGTPELVVGVAAENSGSPGIFVYAFDATTGEPEWQSPLLDFSAQLYFLRIAEVDGDPAPEVVVGAAADWLAVLDGATGALQLQTGDLDLFALDTADRDGDGVAEIFIGTTTGLVERVDAASGDVVETIADLPAPVDGLDVVDLDGDGVADYLLGNAGHLLILDGATGGVAWKSDFLGDACGRLDTLRATDLDGDGRAEVVVSNNAGVQVFQRTPGAWHPTLPPGPSGSTGLTRN